MRGFEFDGQAPAAIGELGSAEDAGFLRGGGGVRVGRIGEDYFDRLMDPVAAAVADDEKTVAGDVDREGDVVERVVSADPAADEDAHAEFDAAATTAVGAG